jgi:excisionase family DNA binding protein
MTDRDKLLFKPAEVADRLSTSLSTVNKMLNDGRLPYVILPDTRERRIRAIDLNQWVKALAKQSAEAVS